MRHENHLFIIWKNAKRYEKEILLDIGSKFEILYKIEVKWSRRNFSHNLSRFYGANLPPNSHKEKHIGVGKFLVVVVRDNEPDYDYHETTAGHKFINSRTFLSKVNYRELTGGGHKIHGTNTQQEFTHDFALLFGMSLDDFTNVHKVNSKKTIYHKADLVGAKGWTSLKQVFDILNLTDNYVVMRNFKPLPERYYANKHGDIDFLVDDYDSFKYTLNAEPVFSESYRVHHRIRVAHQEVLIDIRYVGDGYYDMKWQEVILKSKVVYNGFFVMDDINHFYSLLYHAVIHKDVVANDYITTLKSISKRRELVVGSISKEWFNDGGANKQLASYLFKKKYSITKPEPSVYFNQKNISQIDSYLRDFRLKKKLGLDEAFVLDVYRQNDERRYYKATKGGEKWFIKSSYTNYSNEYRFLKLVYQYNQLNFVRPITYKKGEMNCLVTEWCEGGIGLEEFLRKNKKTINKQQKDILLTDLKSIADTLWTLNISHRDLIPRNFLVADGRLLLIDFYWAVNNFNYKEYPYVIKNPQQTIPYLGEKFAKGMYEWDDSYSFFKIAQMITGRGVESPVVDDFSSRIGERVIRLRPKVLHDALTRQSAVIKDIEREKVNIKALHIVQIAELEDTIVGLKGSKDYLLGKLLLYPLRKLKHVLSRLF